jgi:DinB superfamily
MSAANGRVDAAGQSFAVGDRNDLVVGCCRSPAARNAKLEIHMLESEKREILAALETGSGALRAALAGIDERAAARKPGPASWSILECVEHLAVSERFLLSRLTSASRSGESHENRRREAVIAERGLDRTRRTESPEAGRPGGRFASLTEALSAFDAARAETIRFVEGFGDDLRLWITDHPSIPGPVNCHEMLLIISVHPARHARQITEIRAVLDSPGSGDG